MTYPVQRRNQRRRDLAVVHFEAGADEISHRLDPALAAIRAALALPEGTSPGPVFILYRPGPGVFRVAVGYAVDAPIRPTGPVVPDELPEGEAAANVHAGPPGELHRAYERLHVWIAASGRRTRDLVWEEYHFDPADPDQPVRITVVWPLLPAPAATPPPA